MIGTLLLCQFIAPLELMNIPKFYRNVKAFKVENYPGGSKTFEAMPELGEEFEEARTDEWPPTTTIFAQHKKGELEITINSDTNELIGYYDDMSGYEGSGMIGVMLFGIPGIIFFSPILLVVWFIHWLIKKCTGKKWQYWIAYRALKNQLMPDVAEMLNVALSKRK